MLTTDAFLSGAGEMDRLRQDAALNSASAGKAAKNTEAAESGGSFSKALEDIQRADDNAGVSGTAAEASAESGVSAAVASAEEKAESNAVEAALSKKGSKEKDARAAQEDALYARLSSDAALAAIAAEGAQAPLEEAALEPSLAESDNLSSIITAITADVDEAADVALVALQGEAEPSALDDMSLEADKAKIGDEPSNLSSIKNDANEGSRVAIANGEGSDAPFAEAAFFERSSAESLEAEPLKAKIADAPLAGQEGAATEAAEDAVQFAVTDLRTRARLNAESTRDAARAAIDEAKAAAGQEASAPAETLARGEAKLSGEAFFEGDGLLGGRGLSSSAAGSSSLQGAGSSEASSAGPASFAERLAAELRNNAADIVRAGQIVLRGGGEGTIRLALHPETLGAVRIHLEMSGDKKVSGRITVASREAWDAFSESMESLVAAFSEEGFDTAAGFDLAWAGRGGSGAEGGKVSAPFYASAIPDVMPGGDLADDYTMAAARRSSGSLYSVDLFA